MKRPQVTAFFFYYNNNGRHCRKRKRKRRLRIRGGGRVRGRAGRGVHGQRRQTLSNEIRATLVDHVINHGLTMREAGQRVQPNLSRFTVASVIRTFRLENRTERRHYGGGRGQMFTGVQEAAIVNLVLENNEIRLQEIQSHIIQDNTLFSNIQRVSLSTLARILKRNQIRMKQLYKMPFERNSQRNKEFRQAYVDVVLEMDAHAIPHEFIFIDKTGFYLAKSRRRGRNVIGHRAIIDVPGQRGGNITMCAAISSMHGVLHRHANLGPYNTAHIPTFLDRLHNILIPPECMNDADHQRNRYVVVWDNVSFHRASPVQHWFADHPTFLAQYLPPHSPFLNPIEEFFSAWRWKVYDWQPFVCMPLVQAMEEACDEIDVGAIQGWIRHSRHFFPRCLAREDIACDVDVVARPGCAAGKMLPNYFSCLFFYCNIFLMSSVTREELRVEPLLLHIERSQLR
ncbi:uncharacterized protein LOC113637723 [Tachysurus fulvidraco]|uniref:uncharacterized protein LOC113637723 n=1 Tax=Tachysurus fulvidraco TaxID=1234273 RepID=UPI001FEFC36F|nr:uncharacterized protein LOC113637723 [Tachysurus fulvidraco]XP_047676534.1 uncharacterized protein LOC113637723 [Tachysurus fulvidraco]XP_047676536.1 uncharacterized protein LOC113637723 [Tachysurus fulvidraco]XP_047676537.1 uncharacterized protein LOC113637723 [Tachysurus fulvidraco]